MCEEELLFRIGAIAFDQMRKVCIFVLELNPSDFIRFSGEKERLCGILPREQAVRYHRGECGISQLTIRKN